MNKLIPKATGARHSLVGGTREVEAVWRIHMQSESNRTVAAAIGRSERFVKMYTDLPRYTEVRDALDAVPREGAQRLADLCPKSVGTQFWNDLCGNDELANITGDDIFNPELAAKLMVETYNTLARVGMVLLRRAENGDDPRIALIGANVAGVTLKYYEKIEALTGSAPNTAHRDKIEETESVFKDMFGASD